MEIRKVSNSIMGSGNYILYGPSGCGKTYSASTIQDKTLILSAEKGLRTLVELTPDMDVADINNLTDMKAAHETLFNGTDYKVVLIDSLTELCEMALSEAKANTKDGRQAYMKMADTMTNVIKAYNDLPQTVIFICQEERIADEMMGQVDHIYAPAIPGKKFMTKIPFKFDFVFCLRTRTGKEGKLERRFQTGPNNDYLAKSRSQKLETFEEANWEVIFNKLK